MSAGAPILFVDCAKAGRSDPSGLAKALEIDAYKAKLLLTARVPFLAQGFPSLGMALKAAETLTADGIPASAHSGDDVGRVPAAIAASALARRDRGFVFATASGEREIPFDALRAVVHAKLTAKPVADETEGGFGLPLPSIRRGGMSRPVPEARQPVHYWRLDVFAEPKRGQCVRVAVRHDLFDYSCLGAAKTLSGVRNLVALRDEIARARPGGDAPIDDAFEKTELARAAFEADTHSELDVRTGAHRAMNVESNRAAFERYAALRFLHERTRVPEKADHYFEL